jgi:hypothetical protein
VLSRLPKAEIFINAVETLNEKAVSLDNLSSLVNNWPADEFDSLLEEAANSEGAKWDKAETYFIKLGQKKKFEVRLRLWIFKLQFASTIENLLSQCSTLLQSFKELRSN